MATTTMLPRTVEVVAELRRLAKECTTNSEVVAWLNANAASIETETAAKQESQKKQENPDKPAVVVQHKPKKTPTVTLTQYAWYQTDPLIKIIVTLKGVEQVPSESIKLNVPTKNSFSLDVLNLNGKNYKLTVELANGIVESGCTVKVKKDKVYLSLKKESKGQWEVLTLKEAKAAESKKSKMKSSTDDDPQASIMNLMRDMYNDGDDQTKRMIGEAWTKARTNKD